MRSKRWGKRPRPSGRQMSAEYRRNRVAILAMNLDGRCAICGHNQPPAMTVDHRVPAWRWPKLPDGRPAPGLDRAENLRPAHGSLGRSGAENRCRECERQGVNGLCNQREARKTTAKRPQTRDWFGDGGAS